MSPLNNVITIFAGKEVRKSYGLLQLLLNAYFFIRILVDDVSVSLGEYLYRLCLQANHRIHYAIYLLLVLVTLTRPIHFDTIL